MGAQALAAGLPESVTELYLDDCGIRSDGAQALAAALPRWPNLVRLGASDNPMGEQAKLGCVRLPPLTPAASTCGTMTSLMMSEVK